MITIEPRRGGKARVTFELPHDLADGQVSVVGDFNDWTPAATPMKRKDGLLTASVTVNGGGRFAFRYLAEGGQWFDDEDAHAYEPNGMGGPNGIVEPAVHNGNGRHRA